MQYKFKKECEDIQNILKTLKPSELSFVYKIIKGMTQTILNGNF